MTVDAMPEELGLQQPDPEDQEDGFRMGHVLSYVPITEDDEDEESVEDNHLLDPADTDVKEEPEEPVELTFEEKYADLEFAAMRQSVHREMNHRILGECLEMKELPYLEDLIASWPEFDQATLSQYHLIHVLVKHHGLELIYLDDQGEPIAPERLEGLDEDEQDDLIAQEAFLTTDAGRMFYEATLPKTRIEALFEDEPYRVEAFQDILAYCKEGLRSYMDISNLLEGRDVLTMMVNGAPQKIQPSVLIDRLNRAGALVWDEGWKTTEEGEGFLREEV